MSVYVEHTSAVAVVRPQGGPDGRTLSGLRTALQECLADQPVGVVVDATDLSTMDAEAMAVIGEYARESDHWPGARIAVAQANEDLLTAAHRMDALGSVVICPDVQSARRELGSLPVTPRLQLRISPDRSAPYRARTAVQDFCRRHATDGHAPDGHAPDGHAPAGPAECEHAQLVVSELITNTVMHAGTPIVLTLRMLPNTLSIAVRDGDQRPAKIAQTAHESSERGRGLMLVDAFALSWGTFITSGGKVVWAMVRVPQAPRRREAAGQPVNVARDELHSAD